jgi:hypothetical protein
MTDTERSISESFRELQEFAAAYAMGYATGRVDGAKQLVALAEFLIAKKSEITSGRLRELRAELERVWKDELRPKPAVSELEP